MDFLQTFTGVDLSLAAWGLLFLVGLNVGIMKTAIPGVGILNVTVLALVLPSRLSVGVLLPIVMIGDLFAMGKFRGNANRKVLFALMPSALLGLGAGYLILKHASDDHLKLLIGWVVLVLLLFYVVVEVLERRKTVRTERRDSIVLAAVFGFLVGAASGMANAAGPVMSVYLLLIGVPKLEFIGTNAWFFFVVNLLKLPMYLSLGLINGGTLRLSAAAIPGIVIGALLGYRIVRHIPQKTFNRIILAVTFFTALRLVL
ncbi:MAG TPA: hypothetical protein DIC53_07600 [Synergistaceae bacterium]|nr:hypothetical protein [Synergistaceae bacterium]